jgi:hypothetical protein
MTLSMQILFPREPLADLAGPPINFIKRVVSYVRVETVGPSHRDSQTFSCFLENGTFGSVDAFSSSSGLFQAAHARSRCRVTSIKASITIHGLSVASKSLAIWKSLTGFEIARLIRNK